MIDFNKAYDILDKYNQTHILKYFDELSDSEKESLLKQIELTDFSVLDFLENNNCVSSRGDIRPLGAVTLDEINKNREEYTKHGLEVIKNNEVCAVLLAGGQGTRLGFDKPKGMFDMGITRNLYIFQCLMNNLLDVVNKAGVFIPLYIMTSEKNNNDTVKFFEEQDYFGYDRNFVKFFIQDMAPSADRNGKVLMESKSCISLSPNGNGGWFSSMVRAGLLDELKVKNIKWINVFAVDNVLQRIADPAFVGAVSLSGCQSGSKVVSKASPDERVGVLCLEDGKPSIVEYYEMTEEMRTMREENGRLSYNYGVILNYLFSLERLEEIVNEKLPIHVVEKKIPHMNDEGELICPETPNGYKFETLVLDMVHMQNSCLSFEVEREKEFAPVKNAVGVDSVDSARELLRKNDIEL